ncbi:hypothetical protein FIE12Z_2764 [Fusarium flagelliforme]|uniref:Uncharacterized protein n=1 Tax=Fusarium flagelliforme TaxID=2675880 RepID=A0A395MZQ8_9HYPO|nr:hypothetical protein FIE12Z_2764 [Fusarium flagelliforme]
MVLPPLTNLCFYFVHPEFNLDNFNFTAFWDDVLARADERLRLEIFCTPGGTDADCAHHYRKELEARGDLLEQVREVERAENDPEYAAARKPEGKLPGLVSSHSSLFLAYHGLVFVYRDATWDREDDEKTIDVVQFDPDFHPEELGPGEQIKPQPPLRTTQVRATRKSEIEKYEDQGVWVWFHDHMPRHWWYPALHATFGAQDMGWTSW